MEKWYIVKEQIEKKRKRNNKEKGNEKERRKTLKTRGGQTRTRQ